MIPIGRSTIKPLIGRDFILPYQLTYGLVGCWLFNEQAGGKLLDATGGPAAAVLPVGWIPGGYKFTVADANRITIGANDKYHAANYTVFVVALLPTGAPNWSPIIAYSIQSYFSAWVIQRNSSLNQIFMMARNSGGGDSSVSTGISLDTFYSFGMVYNGSMTGYLNGTSFGNSGAFTPATITTDRGLYIGGSDEGVPFYGASTIKCAFIFNRALSATEIRQLHELTAGW